MLLVGSDVGRATHLKWPAQHSGRTLLAGGDPYPGQG